MDISHARRILVVGSPDCGALEVIKELTSNAPIPDFSGSLAGLTHEWDIKTQYYSAKVPIWIDEITDIETWKTEFLKAEAKEVVEAVGAWVYCFRRSHDGAVRKTEEDTMSAIQEVVEEHAGFGADVVSLAVALPSSKEAVALSKEQKEEADDMALQYGFEYIDYAARGTNDFGEKQGFERLKEALEANEWADTGTADDDALDDLGFEGEDDFGDFSHEEAEMTAELFGMKASLIGDDEFEPEAEDFAPVNDQKTQVDDLHRMMGKLLAIKEQSADLSEAQKKRMAAQAVKELMKADDAG